VKNVADVVKAYWILYVIKYKFCFNLFANLPTLIAPNGLYTQIEEMFYLIVEVDNISGASGERAANS
jgi:hypothetical protein